MSTDSGLITINSVAPSGEITPGSVRAISQGSRYSLDPEQSAYHNCNFGGANLMPASIPGRAPWIYAASGWAHATDYCGSVYCKDYGAKGSIMQYGNAGHAAGGPCIWMRYDIATAQWSLVGRALPTNSLNGYVAGSSPPTTRFDHTWGDWIGGSPDWPAGWAQPGFNPPEGSHTRASFCYRPGSKAGNTAGQIIATWQPTGLLGGTGIRGSFIFDLATGLWSRTTNLRAYGSSMEAQYHEATDTVLCSVQENSHWYDFVDVLDCTTWTWTRKYATGSPRPYINFDSSQFIIGDLFVVCVNASTHNPPVPFTLWATPISSILGGAGFSLTQLNLTPPSAWPVSQYYPSLPAAYVNSLTLAWTPHPDGNLYTTARGVNPHLLWRLVPPVGDDAAKLAGTWTIDTQTLSGDSMALSSTDYSRLQYVPPLNSFVWTGESMNGPVQAIRPL